MSHITSELVAQTHIIAKRIISIIDIDIDLRDKYKFTIDKYGGAVLLQDKKYSRKIRRDSMRKLKKKYYKKYNEKLLL